MADSRPAQSRAENFSHNAKQKNAAVARAFGAAKYPDGSFAIPQGRVDRKQVAVAMRAMAGSAARPAALPPLSLAPRSGPQSPDTSHPHGVLESIVAGTRGALDSLPFELGNYAPAFASAVVNVADDPYQAFSDTLDAQRAMDRDDEIYHPTARHTGEVIGNLLQAAVPALGVARVARLAQATRVMAKEGLRIAAHGGVANAALQVGADGLAGRRSSAADVIGSGVGGMLGTYMALRGKPGAVGSVTGAATSLVQDALNGNFSSLEEARAALMRASDAAAAAGLSAGVAGRLGARQANKLPIKKKGDLGEWLSEKRTMLRGDRVVGVHERVKVPGGYTIADHLTPGGGVVEAKFGPFARLSRRQEQARQKLAEKYRVDSFLPNDVGAAIDLGAGMLSHGGYNLYSSPSGQRHEEQ